MHRRTPVINKGYRKEEHNKNHQEAQEEKAKQASDRHNVLSDGGRSDRIRTYNFPQNRVTDHRINLTLYNLDRVIEGGLSPLLDALYERDVEERLQQHLAPGTL